MKPCEQFTVSMVVLALLALLVGCRASFGPGPTASFTFAQSTYTHLEYGECEQPAWFTDMSRPWGTSANEYYVDTEQEAGSIAGEGMSDNLSATIGDDVLPAAVDGAVKVFAPGAGVVELLE